MAGPVGGQRNVTPNAAQKSKPEAKTNRSILNFFKKAEVDDSLFLESNSSQPRDFLPRASDFDDSMPAEWRFNEIDQPQKRRRLEPEDGAQSTRISNGVPKIPTTRAASGFVIDDSDEEEDKEDDLDKKSTDIRRPESVAATSELPSATACSEGNPSELMNALCAVETPDTTPKLKACDRDPELLREKDGEEWPEETGLDGPENREFRCSQEQIKLENGEAGSPPPSNGSKGSESEETCPICNGSLVGATPDEATRHVNGCLDGKPTPLPNRKRDGKIASKSSTPAPKPVQHSKSFLKPTLAKTPQPKPPSGVQGSAFSKLMANQAEEAAWSAAAPPNIAAQERTSSREQRTCPFYKIMPGFFIAVDAFRYGAVEGCTAYFLSHFHSDHYIGLGSGWCHGPIYCSQVTANLCKQQLRVDEKWLVPLEFEKRYDVPDTGGASVVMIEANHCPGSSLFLFEKTMGAGPRAKKQRILHCGDFRACEAHVTHPLLRPETRDPTTGEVSKQAIDACYLDTTYLNPKYSFPPQSDVIAACAEMCATMQARPDVKRPWEPKLGGNGPANSMSRFVSVTRAPKPAPPSPPEAPPNPFTVASGSAKPLQPRPATTPSNPRRPGGYPPDRLLVVCGTYSIGKERIVVAIAKALDTKIFAPAAKRRILGALQDAELDALLTADPLEAQVHVQSLMDINADGLRDYLARHKPHFARAVAFRPSGWNFSAGQNVAAKREREAGVTLRLQEQKGGGSTMATAGANGGVGGGTVTAKAAPPATRTTAPSNVPTATILHHPAWRSRFGVESMRPVRGWTEEAVVFGVPYSEHSSFRDLALFVLGLDIVKVVPTVNVGSAESRSRMRAWCDRWIAERRRGGFVRPLSQEGGGGGGEVGLWDGKGKQGVYW